jgi:hypothetical protein
MVNLIRYVGADALSSQRWVAPVLAFFVALALINANSSPLLATYGASVACLLPVGVWLSIVVVAGEDPIQAAITTATVGSDVRVRMAKILTAGAGCALLAVLATVTPLLAQNFPEPFHLAQAVAGLAGLLLVSAAAAAVGSVGVGAIRRAGWAFLAAVTLCLADVVVAGAPPTRALLELFDGDHPSHLASSLLLIAGETSIPVVLLVAACVAVARRRA